jgi:uncharacterized protein
MTDADRLVDAIHAGDVDLVRRLVASDGALASSPLGGRHGSRTPLHVTADWPGYFPNGPEVVRVLIAAGADPDARDPEPGSESALHWAASSGDVDVARALIDGGADVNLPDGSIGTPLENAIGYGCWGVARLLVDRGARIDKLWTAAALGASDQLRALMSQPDVIDASPDAVSQAFWHACNAGQRRTAELLLDAGADLSWTPDYAHGTPLDAARQRGTQRQNVVEWLEARGARSQDE